MPFAALVDFGRHFAMGLEQDAETVGQRLRRSSRGCGHCGRSRRNRRH
jgi:hypothetical protein